MTEFIPRPILSGKVLLLECRSLGDAVIKTGYIEAIGREYPNVKLHLFTKREFGEIFKNNPYLAGIYYSAFPMGMNSRISLGQALRMLERIWALRRQKFQVCFNNVADFRENFVGRLINPLTNLTVLWPAGHPWRRMVRYGGNLFANETIQVSRETVNCYEIAELVLRALGVNQEFRPRIYLDAHLEGPPKNTVGIHPLASQACRQWSWDKWSSSIDLLLDKGHEVVIFGAPAERRILSEVFKNNLSKKEVSLETGNLESFFKKLIQTRFLIGLDSFAVHAAYALGVHSVMLSGAQDHRCWAPPQSLVVYKDGECPDRPCFNKPRCLGRHHEYSCMKSIGLDDLAVQIEAMEKRLG